MRAIIVAILIGFAFILAACDPSPEIIYDNQTEQTLCFYSSEKGPPTASLECGNAVKASQRKSYLTGICRGDDVEWVMLTVGPGGDQIYTKMATCEEWDRATITIQERGGQFVVTDTLPLPTPTPPVRLTHPQASDAALLSYVRAG